jgi:hypothetical protein
MNTDTIQNAPPLVAQPPQNALPGYKIAFKLQFPVLFVGLDAIPFFQDLLQNDIARALREKGLLYQETKGPKNAFCSTDEANVAATFSSFIGFFCVTSLNAGLATIRAEFASLHALPYLEIGWMDFREGIWRRWHPVESQEPFSGFLDIIRQWRATLDKMTRRPQ